MQIRIKKIKSLVSPLLEPYSMKYLGVFGSYARGTANKQSDIDLLVKLDNPPGLVGYIKLQENLSKILGKKVDLVSFRAVSRQLKPYIYRDLITLYA